MLKKGFNTTIRAHSVRCLSIVVSIFLITTVILLLPANRNPVSTAGGATLNVGGLGAQNYTSIQEAIDNATSGDIIYIYEGTYLENITINKSITLIGENKDTTIIDGNETSDVVHVTVDSVTIKGFTITNSGSDWGDAGVELHITQDCYVANNIITNNFYGIFFHYSSGNNEISNNEISSNDADGIYLTHSDGNIISNNNMFENDYGIQISKSNTNIIDHNTISHNDGDGINLESSNWNRVGNNTVLNNDDGIYLNNSGNNKVEKNILSSNEEGIQISSSSNNVIDGNSVLDNDYGIHLESSDDNTIINNDAISNEDGYRIDQSDNIIFTNNNALDNEECGIKISQSDGLRVADNILSSNSDDGIIFESSNENIITNNNFLKNGDDGIELFSSTYNKITNNTISSNNEYGIYNWEFSNNNQIYHNNIINNGYQAFDNTIDNNQWDNGYLSGGNYWNDYIGGDKKSGSNQDQYGGDGIGDTPYEILAGTGEDRYPLMSPFIPPPMLETNDPPSCNITAPASDAIISGTSEITGSALDSDGMVERVEVKTDDGEWIRAIGTAPWSYEVDTTSLSDGEHEIFVRSFDGMDYSVELRVDVIVDNSVPEEEPESIYEQNWFWLVIALIIIIILLIVVILFTRKASRKPAPGAPPIEKQKTVEKDDEHEKTEAEEKSDDEGSENEPEKENTEKKNEGEKTGEGNKINEGDEEKDTH
ncbi:MAG: right-handed parallel beta-helix repeat-containing protein [Methanomassiliicoccales archaeon]|nr:MAG: right-handed parallel beta-helix repeat-containing protein [Methanomassiliicoccales archaeon]